MVSFFITLVQKIQLTHDVYELIYSAPKCPDILPGQFLLCETESDNSRLRRAYSVGDVDGLGIHLIIKRLENGKGGSKAICEQEIGHTMHVWGPSGGFILPKPKKTEHIFCIGTGTGFAPLYFQIKHILEGNPLQKISFIFGVREEKDLLYRDTLEAWTQKYPFFSFQFCLSRAEDTSPNYKGRVTDYLRENPSPEALYSICGSPAMVIEVRSILENSGIKKEKIFFEQY